MTKTAKRWLTAIVVTLLVLGPVGVFATGESEPGLPHDIAIGRHSLASSAVWCGLCGHGKNSKPRIELSLRSAARHWMVISKKPHASEDVAKIRANYEIDLENARSEAVEYASKQRPRPPKSDDADAKVAQKLTKKVAKAEAKLAEARSSAIGNLNDVWGRRWCSRCCNWHQSN